MPNTSAPKPSHKGWWDDMKNGRLVAAYNGTEVFDFDANDMVITPNTTVTGTLASGAATLASATVTGNLTLSSTLTAGADGVGADGEQLTSGGAAAECDWAAAASLKQFKKILGLRDDAQDVLKMVAETPVYDFRYRAKSEAAPGERIMNTGDVETVYTGIMADEAPWAMHYNGRILNPINAFGYSLLAIKGLLQRIEDLENKLSLQSPQTA
jgi:hypothetical protein